MQIICNYETFWRHYETDSVERRLVLKFPCFFATMEAKKVTSMAKGFKNTKQRSAIMNLLAERNTPLTAEEIGEAIAPSYPKLALSTVYRNLELFTNAGLLEKSFFQDGVTRYSLAKGHHGHYLICTGCQEKIRLEDCPLHELEHKLTDETGFTITDHDLTLYGLCPACKGKTKNGK